MTQRIIEITSPAFVRRSDLTVGGDLNNLFTVKQPLALEIGCGTGHFIIEMAEKRPEINFVAIDIYNKGCFKTCKKIDLLGLTNVRVMRVEACYLIVNYLKKQSLEAIYINCPDPWPKKRHRYRRLVNHAFLQSIVHYLKPNGDFYFSTDFADYAEQVADLIPAADGYHNALDTPFVTHLPDYPTSKYMRRFLDRGQPIHFIHLQRCLNIDLGSLPEPELISGFRSSFGDRHHA